jgi:hypothetical protein
LKFKETKMSIKIQTGSNGDATLDAIPSFAIRMSALGYGGPAYLIFLGTFLYAIGFVSRLVVPKTINAGPTSSLPTGALRCAPMAGGRATHKHAPRARNAERT